ncbi:MAG: transcriptional regulator [Cyclobacterium sp.]|uniref:transcriptional regulator n=1 Tax=unclassified Cyclobacterium TaxID=2615055 RepID=UPI0013D67028|nr:transcriptional regulator [Cyclobacterium sp. SYSU L10401]
MIAIITGDIKDSRLVPVDKWMTLLKAELGLWGKAAEDWDIYRGDSFQLKLKNPVGVLEVAVRIKATIKSIPPLDIRMGIGLGEENFKSKRLLENNGTAYIHSGEAFEDLSKMNQNLLIKSSIDEFNEEMNLMLKLALTVMDEWTPSSARTVYLAMKHPEKTQMELGKLEGVSQHAISARLSRARYEAIRSFLDYFPGRLEKYMV